MKGSDQPSLQDLLDLAADQGDWQLEAILKLELENELDNETPPAQEVITQRDRQPEELNRND